MPDHHAPLFTARRVLMLVHRVRSQYTDSFCCLAYSTCTRNAAGKCKTTKVTSSSQSLSPALSTGMQYTCSCSYGMHQAGMQQLRSSGGAPPWRSMQSTWSLANASACSTTMAGCKCAPASSTASLASPLRTPLQKPPAQHSSCLLRALLARPRPSTPSPSMVLYLLYGRA